MNQKQFTYALRRGLGRCVLAAQAEPERFREQVMKACRKPWFFDAQCEGTRSGYMYDLIWACGDPMPFLKLITEKLLEPNTWGHPLQFYAELCRDFMEDGSKVARKALVQKYREVYTLLYERKRQPRGYDFRRDSFEMLALVMAGSQEEYLRVAADLGRLFRKQPYLEEFFDWFAYKYWDDYHDALFASENPDVQFFLECQIKNRQEWEEYRSTRDPEAAERTRKLIEQRKTLGSHATPELADLIRDYSPEKEQELTARFTAIPVTVRGDLLWHSAGMDVMDLFDPDYHVANPPVKLLYHIYETTLCTCCRESAARLLAERNLLTTEMKAEMVFDSNFDTRKLIP